MYTAAFSPDGKRVLTGSFDGTARIWDISDIVSPTSNVSEYILYQ
jgi:WD40 repeat protein